MNYYNEYHHPAAEWLRELIRQGLIPQGVVDERSISDVHPNDLSAFLQCHFFAGVGGWPLALSMAGWPADRPVWTGSCPCQPFSNAGARRGKTDERHLWPVFARLIGECCPPTVFGEQVASRLGREWIAGVFTDLEELGYACAGADLCAASLAAPHIRQRLFWVANAHGLRGAEHVFQPGWRPAAGREHAAKRGGPDGGMEHAHGSGCLQQCGPLAVPAPHHGSERPSDPCGMADADGIERRPRELAAVFARQQRSSPTDCGAGGDAAGPWARFSAVQCSDGKTRRFEPGSFPLADGVPGRVGLLRGYGNAIVPPVAAAFVSALFPATGD